jgi:hypothetical protein
VSLARTPFGFPCEMHQTQTFVHLTPLRFMPSASDSTAPFPLMNLSMTGCKSPAETLSPLVLDVPRSRKHFSQVS